MADVQDFVAGIENRKDEFDRLKADFDRLKSSYKKGKKGKSFHEHWWNGTIWISSNGSVQTFRSNIIFSTR